MIKAYLPPWSKLGGKMAFFINKKGDEESSPLRFTPASQAYCCLHFLSTHYDI